MTKKLYKKQRRVYSHPTRRLGRRLSIGLLITVALFLIGQWFHSTDIAVLNPRGAIATKEYHLIVFGTILSLLIIIPVFIMTFLIVWKYRASQHTSHTTYTPDWDHDRKLETIWWTVPMLIILVIAGVTIQSSHDLDPFKPISATISDKPPMKIQVIALQWKWLFIYPDQGVASVNYLEFPANTPINFQITSDAPMNSFWIPKLGGQIYAMSGMSTQLHLIADKPGDFRGVSANLSGDGFAGMNFLVHTVPNDEYANWVQNIKQSAGYLDIDKYSQLAKPSKNNSATFYTIGNDNPSVSLYDTVVNKYMTPVSSDTHGSMPRQRTTDTMTPTMMQGMH